MPSTTWVGSRLHALSPFGPIFGKELRTTARRKRTYFLRAFYLLALFLLLLAVWAEESMRLERGGVAARIQSQQMLAMVFFFIFAIFSVGAMAVIGPVLTATTISSERLGRTLDVLLMTPINTWQILSGKLFSRLLVAFTLIGLSLPVLAVVRLLGTIEVYQLCGVVSLAAVTAMTTAAVGMLFSTLLRRAYAVILVSYFTMGVFYVFVPFAVIGATGFNPGKQVLEVLAAINPGICVVAQTDMPAGYYVDWVPCVLAHVGITALLVIASGLLLRRSARRSGGHETAPNPENNIPFVAAASSAGGSSQTLNYSHRQPTQSMKVREVSGGNPVLWREIRRPLLNKWSHRIILSIGVIALLLGSYALLAAENALDDGECQIGYAIIFHGLMWLLVSVLSATAIAQEKESDTWTLLLTTPLSGRTIILGKFLGLLRKLLWPFVLVVAHFLLFTLTGVVTVTMFFFILWIIVTFNAVWVASGIYLSLRLRKATAAVIVNLLLAVGVFGVVPLVLFIGGALLGGERTGERLAEQVAWYTPYVYLGEGIDRMDDYRYSTPYYAVQSYPYSNRQPQYWVPSNIFTGDWDDFYGHRVNLDTYVSIVVVVGLLYLAVTTAILCLTAVEFDRIVGRSPQRMRNSMPIPNLQP